MGAGSRFKSGPMLYTQAETGSGFKTGAGERLMFETKSGAGVVFEPGTQAGCKGVDLRRHVWMSETR